MGAHESVAAALARLDATGALGAVVARDDAAALAAAAALDHEPSRGPLHGVPVTVKDWIDVTGLPCEGESRERTGRRPERDATVVARLRAAGAIVVAKTQPGERHPLHGRCLHPFDADRSPGGSSTGEAVLVAAGASSLGLGSDSGGSIRLPAAWCGVAGLKPTYGLVPVSGHWPRVGARADGRTVIGPLAAHVRELEAPLRVIAGPDGLDGGCVPWPLDSPAAVNATDLTFVVVADEGDWRAAPTTRAAVDRATAALIARGARLVDSALPPHLEESLDITRRYWRRSQLSGADADRQLTDWDRLERRLDRAVAAVDIVVGPVVADVAPRGRSVTEEDYVFTLPWSLTGWPAASVPAGLDLATGMPLAVQVAASRGRDLVVLAVGDWLEGDLAEAPG